MTCDFVPGQGRLVLSRDEFDALRRGDAQATQKHPVPAPALAAMSAPECEVRVAVSDAGGTTRSTAGWLVRDLAVFLTEQDADRFRLSTHHPSYLVVMVARALHLGPRPQRAESAFRVPTMLLPGLLDPDDALRLASVERLTARWTDPPRRAAALSFATGLVREWSVVSTWCGGSEPGGSDGVRLHGVETRAGLWLRYDEGLDTRLVPCSPAELWSMLVLLLPDAVRTLAAAYRRAGATP